MFFFPGRSKGSRSPYSLTPSPVNNANTHLAGGTWQLGTSISSCPICWGWLTVALRAVACVSPGRRSGGRADTTSSSSSIAGRKPPPPPSSRRSVWSSDPSSCRECPPRRPVRSDFGYSCERCAVVIRDSGLFIRNAARYRRRTRIPIGGTASPMEVRDVRDTL